MTLPLIVLSVLLTPAQAPTAAFPEAEFGTGKLRKVHGIPVLTVSGTPEEIGSAIGVLAVKNAPEIREVLKRFVRDTRQEEKYPLLLLSARRLKSNLPPDHLAEMNAAAKSSGFEPDLVYFVNLVADISSGMGCSTLIVENDRSATASPLFGRNFDWFPTQGLTEHTLVIVYRPKNKHAFAAITYAGINGVISGMNDAGLCVTINEIHLRQSADKAGFNWAGAPLLSLYRRVMEECTTVAEAEALLKKTSTTTSACMTLCDPQGGGVIEFTPKTVKLRRATAGICCCTNHFCIEGLALDSYAQKCWRLPKLEAVRGDESKLGVNEIFSHLHEVNQGKSTLQSMVFEPKERVLHLKLGDGPATKKAPVRLELGKLLNP